MFYLGNSSATRKVKNTLTILSWGMQVAKILKPFQHDLNSLFPGKLVIIEIIRCEQRKQGEGGRKEKKCHCQLPSLGEFI